LGLSVRSATSEGDARERAIQLLDAQLTDAIAGEVGHQPFQLNPDEQIDALPMARVQAARVVAARSGQLREQTKIVTGRDISRRDSSYFCTVTLTDRSVLRETLAHDVGVVCASMFLELKALADSGTRAATSDDFGDVTSLLRRLNTRCTAEWSIRDSDRIALVTRRAAGLTHDVVVRVVASYPDECAQLLRLSTSRRNGKRIGGVPLVASPESGRANVIESGVTSDLTGGASVTVVPTHAEPVRVSIAVSTREIARALAQTREERARIQSALADEQSPRAVALIDPRDQVGTLQWDVQIVSHWQRKKRWLGSSVDLSSLALVASIESSTLVSQQASIYCTGIEVGKYHENAEAPGWLLGSFPLPESGFQVRPLSSDAVHSRINRLVLRDPDGASRGVRLRFSLVIESACPWSPRRFERWGEIGPAGS
jgi:hypothetical protein